MLAETFNTSSTMHTQQQPIILSPFEPMFSIVDRKLKRGGYGFSEVEKMTDPMIITDDNYQLLTMIEAPTEGWDLDAVENTDLPTESSVVFIGSVMIGWD